MARAYGYIANWQDEKGFGFIAPNDGSKAIFFHIRAWMSDKNLLQSQCLVKYDLSTDPHQRVCAINVEAIPALVDGMVLQAGLLRWLPEKKLALLQHEDYPKVPFILPEAACKSPLPVIGQKVQGVLKLHSSGHWLMLQAQTVVAAVAMPVRTVAPAVPKPTPTVTVAPSQAQAQDMPQKAAWRSGMRGQGLLQDWQDDKGYGFIQVAGRPRVFFHISHYLELSGRPVNGMTLQFSANQNNGGQWQATEVQCLQAAPSSKKSTSKTHRLRRGQMLPVMVAAAVAVVFLAVLSLFSPALAVWCLGWSVVSFFTYRADKLAARRDTWRVSEKRLHLQDVLGGWAGGLLARQLWRHKTTKLTFVVTFWLSVVINLAALVWLLRNMAHYLPKLY